MALTGTAAVLGAYSANQARHARRDAEGAAEDAKKERERAKAQATIDANTQIALRKKAMRENSLLTGGGSSGPDGGRTTLGV